ncbi:hypothetical protein NWP96_00400 [Mycoplasmopsis cynos]|nr:hypothetical protein [Mycoplasmopsis cynos]
MVQAEKVIKAYNLIDGIDKSKYPAQTKSYRQNLITLYPNGFENSGNNNFKTALFPEGFKNKVWSLNIDKFMFWLCLIYK